MEPLLVLLLRLLEDERCRLRGIIALLFRLSLLQDAFHTRARIRCRICEGGAVLCDARGKPGERRWNLGDRGIWKIRNLGDQESRRPWNPDRFRGQIPQSPRFHNPPRFPDPPRFLCLLFYCPASAVTAAARVRTFAPSFALPASPFSVVASACSAERRCAPDALSALATADRAAVIFAAS